MSMNGLHVRNCQTNAELKRACEIVPDLLYFISLSSSAAARRSSTAHFFAVDNILLYEPFFGDFGPLNLGCLYRFCETMNAKMKIAKERGKVIYFYCGSRLQFRANAAVLIGAYSVLYLGKTPSESYAPLTVYEPYMPFRDAATGPVTFRLTPLHCIRAIERAKRMNLFDFEGSFNVEEYEYFECVENGDLTIMIQDKFIAFAGPHSTRRSPDGYPTFTPEDYVPVFKKYKVNSVLRVNKKLYDKKRFTNYGFKHHDHYFIDGTTPSRPIVNKFIHLCETEGNIAVHCKAGLGRTGTLMGMYMMYKWEFPYEEAIAWLRLARPGSVIGPQQHFLQTHQQTMWAEGREARGGRPPRPLGPEDGPKKIVPKTRSKVSGRKKAFAKKSSPPRKVSSNTSGPASPNRRSPARSSSTRSSPIRSSPIRSSPIRSSPARR